MDLNVTGLSDLRQRLLDLGVQMNAATGNALRAEAEIMMTEAKERTPVKTGALRASGTVEQSSDGLVVTLSFGGPSADYAVYVHENLEARHEPPYGTGGQAKFLESVILEHALHLADDVASRVAKDLGT